MNDTTDAQLKMAKKLFDQGNYNQAIKCYQAIDPSRSNLVVQEKILCCSQLLLRKFWKQKNCENFEKLAIQKGWQEQLALPLARLKGENALKDLSQLNETIASKIAQAYLSPDLKQGLLLLRQIPHLKTVAEGWLAALKGEVQLAIKLFSSSASEGKVEAMIGLDVCHWLLNQRSQMTHRCELLKSYLGLFPELSKALGKDEENDVSLDLYKTIIFETNLTILEERYRSLLPKQKALRALISLKIGDLVFQDNLPKAIACWHTASDHPKFELDVSKRLYLSSYDPRSTLSTKEKMFNFYKKLKHYSELEAKNFINHLALDSSLPFADTTHHSELQREGRWLVGPMTTEIKFLWLMLFFRQSLTPLSKVLFFTDEDCEIISDFSSEQWKQFFGELDPHYPNCEKYLRAKLTMAQILSWDGDVLSVITQLVSMSAHYFHELIPIFSKHAIKIVQKKTDLKVIQTPIRNLQKVIPNHYDLVRLELMTITSKEREEHLNAMSTQLSKPLFDVLKFQAAIDFGSPLSIYKSLIPPLSSIESKREACWRLVAAITDKKSNLKETQTTKIIHQLYNDDEELHLHLRLIESYDQSLIPHSLLSKWVKKKSENWRPHFHLAHYYKMKNLLDEGLDSLNNAYELVDGSENEYNTIANTLKYYSARKKMLELLKIANVRKPSEEEEVLDIDSLRGNYASYAS